MIHRDPGATISKIGEHETEHERFPARLGLLSDMQEKEELDDGLREGESGEGEDKRSAGK